MKSSNTFDAYELLSIEERETVSQIICEALSRSNFDLDNIDYEIKTTVLSENPIPFK